ncbi:MAG TPA: Ig-like domain repeat protein, partial [Tepidisphaeraceae bacterium]|nr:Ig-like domain repeat protein [Tepidisphaeraceae bacterium]
MLRASHEASRAVIEPLETRQLLSGTSSTGGTILTPSHVVVVLEEDRFANAIGDTTNMPYTNQLASTGLVYTNAHGLNTTSQEGQMAYLALYSGSTQGVTGNSYQGPFSGANLAQTLNNAGLGFVGYAEAMPHDGDTTDQLAADPTNSRYDDLYTRSYNPMAQFTSVGTGKVNSDVNKTFASFPTTTAGFAALPAVTFVVPDTLHNTHGSNDTNPYATDPSAYNLLRQDADNFLKSQINGYIQWAKQNNSLVIIVGDEGDRAHGFTSLATNKITMIVNGSTNLFVPGTDSANVNVYNVLRTMEDMYGVTKLASSSNAATLDTNAAGQLSGVVTTKASTTTALATSATPSTFGQSITFTATVSDTTSGTPSGTITFLDGSTQIGTGTLNGSGVATFITSALTAGSHSITAQYGGDANFASSVSSALAQTINKAATSTAVASSATPSTFGQSVTFTATVSDSMSASPTGTVSFLDGSTVVGTGTLNGSGVATFTTSSLSVATHSITAQYGGDTNFASSQSGALSQTV